MQHARWQGQATYLGDARTWVYWVTTDFQSGVQEHDFPHGNSTWPKSREVVARDLGTLPAKLRPILVRENVAKVYNIPVPSPVQ